MRDSGFGIRRPDKCHCWEKFYDWNWTELLKAQPQFADKRGK